MDGVVIGVLQATNKIIRGKPRSPRDDLSDLSFSANDALLLTFIATNAGLALKQSVMHQSMSSFAPIGINGGLDFKRMVKLDPEQHLQSLVEGAYNILEAERVSVFTYNAQSHVLICAMSKDIKGMAIPTDKGFAGMSFTSMRVINVVDAKQDDRHNKEVDKCVGFTTRSLLCAPIFNSEGVAIGVVQAVNKVGGSKFTSIDEEQIQDMCKMLWALMKDKSASSADSGLITLNSEQGSRDLLAGGLSMKSPVLAATSTSFQSIAVTAHGAGGGALSVDAVNLTRSVANMILSGSLEELVAETERVVFSFTSCDSVGVYALDGSSLYRIKQQSATASFGLSGSHASSPFEGVMGSPMRPSGSKATLQKDRSREAHFEFLNIADIPMQIKQALQFKSVVEYKLPPEQKEPGYVLPDLKAYQALIFPVASKAFSYEPGACTLIVANANHDSPFTETARETLEIIADYFNKALQNIHDRLTYEDSMRTLKSNFNLVNNTLGVLKDYVMLLNSEGNLVACNKLLEDLLGRSSQQTETRKGFSSGSFDHTTDSHCNTNSVGFEGRHYSSWLTPSNSPELVRDIANALLGGKSKTQEVVKFISPAYPEGVYMDYQVVYIENPDSVERVSAHSPHSPPVVANNDRINDESTFAVVVIVQIHSEKIPRIQQNGGFLTSVNISHTAIAHHDSHSAHGVVDAATSIINTVRSSFDLDPEIHESLRLISANLSNASRRLSLTSVNQSAVSMALMNVECPLVHPSVVLPDDMEKWEFDVTQISSNIVLCSVIGRLFDNMFDLAEIGVDSSTMSRFIIEVGKNYHDRPFHNLQHAACVTHFAYMLINATKARDDLKPFQLFGILVSAVVHDVDHPGNTNLFEINSSSELALRYNDQSVLENHHCSTAFRLMRKPNMQILGNLPKAMAVDIRKIVISCVMATDMAVHFELIDETKKRAMDGWNFSEAKDQSLLGKILLHAADLSNPVRPFQMTRRWAERISMEFNDQVTREQALGMPVLGFMMTPDEKAFCKNETGFASFVVAPMWRAIAMLYPDLSFLVAQLDSNLLTWKATLEKIQREEQEKAAAAAVDATSSGGTEQS
jgi:hypothetical protein